MTEHIFNQKIMDDVTLLDSLLKELQERDRNTAFEMPSWYME